MMESILKEKPNPPKLGNPFDLKGREETCFTWAKKKLSICDIKLKRLYTDWIAAVTSLHAPYPPEDNNCILM